MFVIISIFRSFLINAPFLLNLSPVWNNEIMHPIKICLKILINSQREIYAKCKMFCNIKWFAKISNIKLFQPGPKSLKVESRSYFALIWIDFRDSLPKFTKILVQANSRNLILPTFPNMGYGRFAKINKKNVDCFQFINLFINFFEK